MKRSLEEWMLYDLLPFPHERLTDYELVLARTLTHRLNKKEREDKGQAFARMSDKQEFWMKSSFMYGLYLKFIHPILRKRKSKGKWIKR